MLDNLVSNPLGLLVAVFVLCLILALLALTFWFVSGVARYTFDNVAGRNTPDQAMWQALKVYAVGMRTVLEKAGDERGREAVDCVLAHMVYLEGLHHPATNQSGDQERRF